MVLSLSSNCLSLRSLHKHHISKQRSIFHTTALRVKRQINKYPICEIKCNHLSTMYISGQNSAFDPMANPFNLWIPIFFMMGKPLKAGSLYVPTHKG
jgi:hypothetical protein